MIGHLTALACVAIATVVAAVLQRWLGLREPSLVFLMAVLASALAGGLSPSLVASAVSVLSYDFFFTEPYHTFTIEDPQDILSVLVFLVVAVLVSHLTARVRSQAAAAEAREDRTASLYAFTREMVTAVRLDDLLAIIARHIGERFGAAAIILLPRNGALEPRAAFPPGAALPERERETAAFAWAEGRSATMAVQTAAGGAAWLHVSLGTIRGEVAVLCLDLHGPVELSEEDVRLLDAFTQQAGVALERCLADAPATAASTTADGPLAVRVHALEQRIDKVHEDLAAMSAAARELLRSAPPPRDAAE